MTSTCRDYFTSDRVRGTNQVGTFSTPSSQTRFAHISPSRAEPHGTAISLTCHTLVFDTTSRANFPIAAPAERITSATRITLARSSMPSSLSLTPPAQGRFNSAEEQLAHIHAQAKVRYGKWATTHKQQIRARSKRKYAAKREATLTCPCGKTIRQVSLQAHLRTNVHQRLIAANGHAVEPFHQRVEREEADIIST